MVDLLGLVAIVFFYLLILAVGIWAGRKSSTAGQGDTDKTDDVMLAGRNIGTLVGIFTMTATWVGGAYINGTAEALYNGGLLGCQAPFGYSLSLVLGGVLFAEKMRTQGYVTMLDPFQDKFGQRVGGLLFVPALLGEVFWSAAILAALGATLSVILGVDINISVVVSALIAIFYTFTGGLYSVAYTDVVQLFCIFIGLWVCIPAALLSEATSDISRNAEDWMGQIGGFREKMLWMDYMLLLVFGGIPWQVYFQRVLSAKTASGAKMLSYVAAFGCLTMAVPPVLIGAIARNTNWTYTNYDPYKNGTKVEGIPPEQRNMVVPLVFQQLTPPWIAFVGLGAVSAAVMSSADSSVLSAASMFARNIWKLTIRPHASENEVIMVMRIAIVAVGLLATVMALTIHSIYGLWYLCADLVYVILFPQLLCVVYMDRSNTYGSLAAYAVGLFLRLSGGEQLLHFPALIHFPMYDDETATQYFPFRTLSMVSSLFTIVTVSILTDHLFKSGRLAPKWDIMKCLVNIPIERVPLPTDTSFNVSSDTLAMHRINTDTSSKDEANGFTNPLLLGANGRANFGAGSSTGSSPITEMSALAPSDYANKDYSALDK